MAVVDLQKGNLIKEISVGRGPGNGVLSGEKLFIPCQDDNTLVIIDSETGKVVKRLSTEPSPRDVVVLGNQAFVICRDSKTLLALDWPSGKKQFLPLPGWPQRIITWKESDPPSLLVLSTLTGKAFVSLVEAGDNFHLVHTKKLTNVTNARGLARLGGKTPRVVVAHQNPRTNIPTTQIAQGWVFTNSLGVFSMEKNPDERENVSVLLDSPQQAFADPSDVVCHPKQNVLFAASAGRNQVVLVKTDQLTPNYAKNREDETALYPREELSQTRKSILARIPTGANPRRMALSADGKLLVVSNYLDDSLTVIDVPTRKVRQTISLQGPEPDAARKGRILFHSAQMTAFGQFSCASCHPHGSTDGLQWDLTRNGLANFMNTRSLLGVKNTANYGWHGESPTLKDRVQGTLRNLHRHEPTKEELTNLVAFLRTLPAPLPLPTKESEKAAREKGKALFFSKARCSRCHKRPTFQDGLTHNVGTRIEQDANSKFDTPSLVGLARTSPYLHHGKAEDLIAVFRRFNPENRHGQAHLLTDAELADLISYLKSL